jgi:hypothetical protein
MLALLGNLRQHTSALAWHSPLRHDRSVERVARGLVIAVGYLAIAGIAFAHEVLSHGSGTYTATLVFAPILFAPGVLVYLRPKPRFLALWAVWSFISSFLYLIGASPYRYERDLKGWAFVQWDFWIAIALAVVGSTVLAYVSAARANPVSPATARTRRIQQAVRLSCALAVVTVLVTIIALHVPVAANFWNAVFIAFIVAPAPYVHRVARRGAAIMWAAWVSPFATVLAILSLASNDHANELELPLRMWLLSYGTLMTMICVVTPFVALVSSDEQSDLPTARVQ